MVAFVPDSSVVERVEPSPNFDERTGLARPDMIVLHYTGMQWSHDAVHRLCDPKARVSSHYVVMENGSVLQLVPENKRAWHAGVSSWGGDPDVNSRSIGIEICNPGHEFGYPDFPARQIAAVITLCRAIMTRNIVRPENVVAHSDVAPSRKQDPGEKFPWKRLALSGVGLWVEPAPIADGAGLNPGESGDRVSELQKLLADYGYGLEHTAHYDVPTTEVVIAFQRHFRPAKFDGLADASTLATLRKLLAARDQPPPAREPTPVAPKDAKPASAERKPDASASGLFGHPLTPDA
jgi:N-acetylmuramoyl-L-alanine amidase